MPQLNPADFAPQLIWLAIIFVALYLVLSRVAIPHLSGVLEARERRIGDDLDRAAELKGEADQVRTAYEKAVAEARTRAQEVARSTDARLSSEANERQAQLGSDLATQIRDAETRIATARNAAMNNLAGVAGEAARLAVERVAGISVSASEAESSARATIMQR